MSVNSGNQKFILNRRRFLRGLGACMALPAMESLLSRSSFASVTAEKALAASPTGAPLRMAFMYFPNGAVQDTWWPKGGEGEGKDFEFSKTMKPLEVLREKVQVISGLDHVNATAGKDGAGD